MLCIRCCCATDKRNANEEVDSDPGTTKIPSSKRDGNKGKKAKAGKGKGRGAKDDDDDDNDFETGTTKIPRGRGKGKAKSRKSGGKSGGKKKVVKDKR